MNSCGTSYSGLHGFLKKKIAKQRERGEAHGKKRKEMGDENWVIKERG